MDCYEKAHEIAMLYLQKSTLPLKSAKEFAEFYQRVELDIARVMEKPLSRVN